MNKKTLIGSIIAVVLLTLVSFSSVVGYSSVKSDTKIASPLFSIRNNKGDVSSNYIGKGKAINILIPRRNDKTELVEKFVNFIKDMDEQSLDNFANMISNKLESDDTYSDVKRNDVKEAVYFISENPELSKNYLLNGNKDSGFRNYTIDNGPRNIWCIFYYIGVFVVTLILLILLPFLIIYVVLTGFTVMSSSVICCGPLINS